MISEKETFQDLIAVNVLLLRICGILGLGRIEESIHLRDNILPLLAFCSLSVFSVSYTYSLITFVSDLNLALDFFAMNLSMVAAQLRFVLLFLQRLKLRSMIILCEQFWASLTPVEKTFVRKYSNKSKILTYYYLSSCGFTVFFYIVACIIISVTESSKGTNDTAINSTRSLPYVFIIDIQSTPYYEIAYFLQVCVVLNISVTCVATDTICPVFSMVACGHFRVIRYRFQKISCDQFEIDSENEITVNSTNRKNEFESTILREKAFRGCFQYHQTLLEFCKSIKKLSSYLLLPLLISGTYNISLVGFKVAGDDPGKYKYTAQLSVAVMQLYLCNWPPDLLLSESEAMFHAAYSLPWYDHSVSFRRSVNIVIMRSQKPARLTAGGFLTLSLETFAAMMSSAASFFTVINSMN